MFVFVVRKELFVRTNRYRCVASSCLRDSLLSSSTLFLIALAFLWGGYGTRGRKEAGSRRGMQDLSLKSAALLAFNGSLDSSAQGAAQLAGYASVV